MNKILYVPQTIYLLIHIKVKKKHLEQVLSFVYETIAPTHKEQACQEYKILQNSNTITISGK